MKPRSIVFFTGTRAEYGLLRSVMLQLQNFQEINFSLIVSGTHLSLSHGNTLEEIKKDAFPLGAVVDICIDQYTKMPEPLLICKVMGVAMEKFGTCLHDLKPDILVVLGDRYETFCCAAAATILNIPIAHLHGGEQTLGAIDEALRHSITKMSHIHFASCEKHRERVIQLGEQPEKVWNTGALGVENALNLPLLTEKEIREYLDIPFDQPYFLCTFHPVTLEPGQEVVQWQEIQKALDIFSEHAVIITGSNADPGGNAVNVLLAQWAENNPKRVHFFASLGVLRYLSAAKYADCVLGNSSSGILEIPSLKTPVLNIGNRQKGRICSDAVLHCATHYTEIVKNLHKALSPEQKKLAQTVPSPYVGTDVAKKIAQILAKTPLEGITQKFF